MHENGDKDWALRHREKGKGKV
jgi:hypothetical protein